MAPFYIKLAQFNIKMTSFNIKTASFNVKKASFYIKSATFLDNTGLERRRCLITKSKPAKQQRRLCSVHLHCRQSGGSEPT